MKLNSDSCKQHEIYIFWCTVMSLTITSHGIAQVQLNVNTGACKFLFEF